MSWKRYHALLHDGWHTTTLSAAGTHELRLVISNNCCFANIMWIYHVIWRGCCDRLFGGVVSTLSCWSSAIFNNFTDQDERSLVSCLALISTTTRQKLHTSKWDMSTLVYSNIQNHEQGRIQTHKFCSTTSTFHRSRSRCCRGTQTVRTIPMSSTVWQSSPRQTRSPFIYVSNRTKRHKARAGLSQWSCWFGGVCA